MFPRVTHQCATLITWCKHHTNPVQLACVKPAASVRSEPGSNSHIKFNPVCHYYSKEFPLGSLIYRHLIFTHILPTYPLFFFTISYNRSFQNLARKNLSSFYHLSRSLPVSGFIWHSFSDVNNFFQKISLFLKFFIPPPPSYCFYLFPLPAPLLILSYLSPPRNIALIPTPSNTLLYSLLSS